jgi:hypothetical protein
MFMANDYTDSYDGIVTGAPLSAAKMTAALNTKEKVANKVTSLSGIITDTEYPSAKAVYDFTVHQSGTQTITGVKTFGTAAEAAEPLLGMAKTDAAINSGTKFASEAQVYSLAQELAAALLPVGIILAMSASSWTNAGAAFQSKWRVCDGTGGAPDLRGRFLRGGTSSDAAIGGADSRSFTIGTGNLPNHTHTVNDPGHKHSLSGAHSDTDSAANGSKSIGGSDDAVPYTGSSGTGITVTGGGKATPDSISISTVPSYYTVVYIMKVA